MNNPISTQADDWEQHWSDYSDSTEKIPSHQFRRRLLKNILQKENLAAATVIDFGSGQGDLIRFIADNLQPKQLIGLELSKTGVAIAQKKSTGCHVSPKKPVRIR